MNRYEQARQSIPRVTRSKFQKAFQAALGGAAQECTAQLRSLEAVHLVVPTKRGGVHCLCSVDVDPEGDLGEEEHVSVSHGRGRGAPTWDELVLVRALAWPDDARVVQEFPPLVGPRAREWINVDGVEVLHLRHYRSWT